MRASSRGGPGAPREHAGHIRRRGAQRELRDRHRVRRRPGAPSERTRPHRGASREESWQALPRNARASPPDEGLETLQTQPLLMEAS
jgi:hypothetical protein